MPITDIHLIGLLERLDVIRENLHLRPLTDREKEDIAIQLGFTTKTTGAVNVVNFGYKWKNVRGKPFKTQDFRIEYDPQPITVITQKGMKKNFNLNVNKEMIPVHLLQNIRIITDYIVKSVKSLTINKGFTTIITTPLSMMPWMKRNNSIKVRGFFENKPINNTEDVGIIDDIEMINIIKQVEMIDAI